MMSRFAKSVAVSKFWSTKITGRPPDSIPIMLKFQESLH